MSSARDLIRTNTGPQSGLIFNSDYESSSFTPKGWAKYHNYSTQKQEVTPQNALPNAFGNSVTFKPSKNADYYGFACLQIPFSSITRPTGDSYCRYVDYVSLFCIEYIKISHVSNLISQLDGNILYAKYKKDSDPRKRHQYDPFLLGNLSPSVRNTLARSAQIGMVPLDGLFWFTYSTSSFIPVIILSHELQFEVKFRDYPAVIQCDPTSGTPSASIATQTLKGLTYNLALIFLTSHITGDERNFQTNLYEGDGLMTPFKEYKQQPRYTITAGQSGVIPVHLTSLKDQISEIWWVLRRQDDVQTNYGNRPSRTLSYVSASFTGNGGEMIPTHTKEWIDRRVREQFHSSWTNEYDHIGMFPLCWIPEDPVNNTGSVHLGIISDPILNINIGVSAGQSEAYDVLFGTGPDSGTGNVVVDVYVAVFNWAHWVGGDVNRTFN